MNNHTLSQHEILIDKRHIYIHQDEKIVCANSRFVERHGYTVQEFLNMNYFELFHPDDRARATEIKTKRLPADSAPQHHDLKRIKKG